MRFGATVALLLSLLLVSHSGQGQESQPSEYQVKAAFVFNFAKFVTWPPDAFGDAASPLLIGVLGDNPFGTDLERAVRDKTLNSRPVAVRKCDSLEEAKKCHVLFISASETKRLPEILAGLAGKSILTVSETSEFIKAGGMINFFREGNRFRFEINDEPAKKAGLKIDSKLLGLGKKPGG